MKKIIHCAVLLFTLLTASAGWPTERGMPNGVERWAELADPVFQHLGTDQGLPHEAVTTVGEDGDGFLWVGTEGGLARWDGFRFKSYLRDPGNPHGLPDNSIHCLHTDRQGRLWIGTPSAGLSRYDRTEDRFIIIGAGPNGLSDPAVYAIAEGTAPGLWVGTNRGLNLVSPDSGAVTVFRHDPGNPDSLPSDEIRSVLVDRQGTVWVGSRSGLAHFNPAQKLFASVPLPGTTGDTEVGSLFQDSKGRIWIGTNNHGAFVLKPGQSVPDPLTTLVPSAQTGQWIYSIAEVAPGWVWLGTFGQGILAVDLEHSRSRSIRHDQSRQSSLLHDAVWTLHRDGAGTVWVGGVAGLSRIDVLQSGILNLFGASGRSDGLSDPDIMSAFSTADGQIWLGTRNHGVDILDPGSALSGGLRPDPSHPDSALPRVPVWGITQSTDGTFYLGTDRGLYRSSASGKNVSRIVLDPQNPELQVRSLAITGNTLWVGGNAEGVWRYDLQKGVATGHWGKNELTDPRILVIEPGDHDQMWFGTRNGLNRLDTTNDKIDKVQADPNNLQALSSGVITTFLTDHQGRVWIGTQAGGISILEGRNQDGSFRFSHLGKKDGLTNDNVNKLLMDHAGTIWASTDDGLAVIDPKTLTVRSLRRAEGVGFSGYWSNAGAMTRQGELLFGGLGGLTVVRPDAVKPWYFHPPVVITDVRVGGRPLSGFEGSAGDAELTVYPDANSLAIEFAALDYSASERTRYAYRLDGFDRDWIETDWTRRVAAYTNLPPGNYTLNMKGSNRDGVWTEKILTLPIRVLPAWYQTWWFALLLAAFAVLSIMAFVRTRTAYLMSKKRELESLVAVRTDQLAQRSEELRQSNEGLSILLDNSGEGFLSLDATLTIDPEYSRVCEAWLDGAPSGRLADEVLFPDDARNADLFRTAMHKVFARRDPEMARLMLSLLPTEITRNRRQLNVRYSLLENGHVMVVLEDVTNVKELAKAVESEQKRLTMIVAAVTDSREFFALLDSFRGFLAATLPETQSAPEDWLRQVHTFKGSFYQFSFEALPQALGVLEQRAGDLMAAGQPADFRKMQALITSLNLEAVLQQDLRAISAALGPDFLKAGAQYRLSGSDAARIKSRIQELVRQVGNENAGVTQIAAELAELVAHIDRINVRDAVLAYERLVEQLAERTEKELLPLVVTGGEDLWVDQDRFGPFLRSLVHLFKNAVVHGIEEPYLREAAGKPTAGTISCRISRSANTMQISVSDDGAGIDAPGLKRIAVQTGLWSEAEALNKTDQQVIDLIFLDNITTMQEVQDLAGRGVGLTAVRAEVERLGGQVSVTSVAQHGTRFEFAVPIPQ